MSAARPTGLRTTRAEDALAMQQAKPGSSTGHPDQYPHIRTTSTTFSLVNSLAQQRQARGERSDACESARDDCRIRKWRSARSAEATFRPRKRQAKLLGGFEDWRGFLPICDLGFCSAQSILRPRNRPELQGPCQNQVLNAAKPPRSWESRARTCRQAPSTRKGSRKQSAQPCR